MVTAPHKEWNSPTAAHSQTEPATSLTITHGLNSIPAAHALLMDWWTHRQSLLLTNSSTHRLQFTLAASVLGSIHGFFSSLLAAILQQVKHIQQQQHNLAYEIDWICFINTTSNSVKMHRSRRENSPLRCFIGSSSYYSHAAQVSHCSPQLAARPGLLELCPPQVPPCRLFKCYKPNQWRFSGHQQ